MREQLSNYVDLLFAGADNAHEIKQEILQNTLDRYDDLIAQGKAPEAAYRLAISGIGDINEILGCETQMPDVLTTQNTSAVTPGASVDKPIWKKVLAAFGVCLYIMCPIPLFVLQDVTGLCGLLTFVAVATALMVISGGKNTATETKSEHASASPESQMKKAVNSIIWTIGLCAYFVLSFLTQAWYITWVIFPLIGAVQGLITACMDLRGENQHEN